MSIYNKSAEITGKLYQFRQQLIDNTSEEAFIAIFRKWSPLICDAMARYKCTELEALIKLTDFADTHDQKIALTKKLNAVVCEMIEPSITSTQETV